MRDWHALLQKRAEYLFLLFAAIFGCFYVFVLPIQRNFDEAAHLLKIYSLSQGDIAESAIPDALHDFLENNRQKKYLEDGRLANSFQDTYSHFWEHEDYSKTTNLEKNPADIYFVTSYWPAIITTTLLKGYRPSSKCLFFAARLSLFMASVFLVFLTIKNAAFDKSVWFFLSSAPMTLFILAGVNAAGLTYAYVIAYLNLLLLTLKHPKQHYFWGLLALGILVALSKNIYALLIPLALLCPVRFLQKMALVGIPLLIATAWNAYAAFVLKFDNSAYEYLRHYMHLPPLFTENMNASRQYAYVLERPLLFIGTLAKSILLWGAIFSVSIVGIVETNLSFGFNDMFLMLMGLAVLFFLPRGELLDIKCRLGFFAVFSVITIAVFTLLYLYYTPVGEGWIRGVQGRYFTLIMPLLFFSLPWCSSKKNQTLAVQFGIIIWIFMNIEACYNIYQQFY